MKERERECEGLKFGKEMGQRMWILVRVFFFLFLFLVYFCEGFHFSGSKEMDTCLLLHR